MAVKDRLTAPKTQRALTFWHHVTVNVLEHMPIDLSARQTAVLLSIYLSGHAHSIKSLADELDISKPAICRAVDALEAAGFIKRAADRRDKRSVLVKRTAKGSKQLQSFAEIMLILLRDVG